MKHFSRQLPRRHSPTSTASTPLAHKHGLQNVMLSPHLFLPPPRRQLNNRGNGAWDSAARPTTSTLTLILQSGHRGCSVGSASFAKGTTCSLPLRPRRIGLSFLLLACGLPPFFGAPSFFPLLGSLLGCGLVRGLASSSPSFPSFLFFLHPVCCWHC